MSHHTKRRRPVIDPLESRQLFASVTFISHGYQPSGKAPSWTTEMASFISAQAPAGADIYRLTIKGRGDEAHVTSYAPVKVDTASPKGDVVVVLDWAASSDVQGTQTSTDKIAQLVVPYFLTPQAGRAQALAELPIHLIGHSRGGSVVVELAKELGEAGIWVDDLTTLDMRPVGNDPNTLSLSTDAPANVIFADNYYQRNGLTLGQTVKGAKNFDLTDLLPGSLSFLDDRAHSDVWAYYGGTINLKAKSLGGNKIESDWYDDSDTGPRNKVGFAYSNLGEQPRPTSGLRFAGADRAGGNVTASGADRWDNATFTSPEPTSTGTTLQIAQGATVPVSLKVEDRNGDATTSLFLDPDGNPYNGNEISLPLTTTFPASTSVNTYSPTIDTAGLDPGVYEIGAKTANGTHARYDYSRVSLTVLPTGVNGAATITVTSTTPTTFRDAANEPVKVKISGPGTGTIFLPTTNSQASVFISGTTAKSSLTLSSKRTSTLSSLSVQTPLKTLSASNVNVISELTLGGPVSKVSLGRLIGATATLAGPVTSFSIKSINESSLFLGFAPGVAGADPAISDATLLLRTLSVREGVTGSVLAIARMGTAKLGRMGSTSTTTIFSREIATLSAKTSAGKSLSLKRLAPGNTDPRLTSPGLVIKLV